MKKLSKKRLEEREEIGEKIAVCHEQMQEATERYNLILTSAKEWTQEVVSEMEDYVSERSERWVESETGSAYDDWKSEWENFDPEEVEVPESVLLDLETLPEEPA